MVPTIDISALARDQRLLGVDDARLAGRRRYELSGCPSHRRDGGFEEAAVGVPERPVLVDKSRSVGIIGALVGALLPGELAATTAGDVVPADPLAVCNKVIPHDIWPEAEVV